MGLFGAGGGGEGEEVVEGSVYRAEGDVVSGDVWEGEAAVEAIFVFLRVRQDGVLGGGGDGVDYSRDAQDCFLPAPNWRRWEKENA